MVTCDSQDRATGVEIMPYLDSEADAYINANYRSLVKLISGGKQYAVAKKMSAGNIASIKFGEN